jgi:hypothetical protein
MWGTRAVLSGFFVCMKISLESFGAIGRRAEALRIEFHYVSYFAHLVKLREFLLGIFGNFVKFCRNGLDVVLIRTRGE